MKVTITTLKAPWPKDAKVGDVVAFEGDTAPAWAVGKFVPAADGAKAAHTYEPAEAIESVEPPPTIDSVIAELREKLTAALQFAANGTLREQVVVTDAAKAPKK